MNVKPRIVIYGAGQFGQYITRFASAKGWPIVAAFNRAGDKIGQDIGRLSGIGDIGVIVQDCEKASYRNLDANIGIVTVTNLLAVNHDAHMRLLNAGINVLCHGSESYYPFGVNPELAAELDLTARTNRVTFTGSGIWDMSRIWSGILVAGPCTEIESLFHSSITDIKGQIQGKDQAYMVGNTFTLEEYEAKGLRNSPITQSYKAIPQMVLDALGYALTETRTYAEPIVFEEDYESELMECTIPAGNCVGTRVVVDVDTEQGVSARAAIELREFRKDDIENMYWEVRGKPITRLRTEREYPAHATIASLFNRIPDVLSAPPGVVLITQLGPLKSSVLL